VQDHKLNTKPLYWAGSKPYVAAADGDGIIAVWTESEYHGPGSVFWSRRDKLGQWTPPSRLEPGIEAAWEERQELSTSSPGGSFVVEWSARTSLLPASPSWFLSKYVAGRWTTVALPWALSQLSINDAGEAVGASYEAACDAAPWCYDLIAYRFRF
jgi:hypothetical protein